MRKLLLFFPTVIVFFFSVSSHAAKRVMATSTPISIGLVPPVQFPPARFTVNGLRITGIYGINKRVQGIDLGLLGNSTEEHFGGLAIAGLLNLNHGTVNVVGLQAAGLANINKGSGNIYGFQFALANLSKFTDVYGAQIGIYNRARNVRGLQIGLVNYAESLVGVQIGLANFNEAGPFAVSPIINVGW